MADIDQPDGIVAEVADFEDGTSHEARFRISYRAPHRHIVGRQTETRNQPFTIFELRIAVDSKADIAVSLGQSGPTQQL